MKFGSHIHVPLRICLIFWLMGTHDIGAATISQVIVHK